MIKKILCATMLAACAPAAFAADVGVSINLGQPGFFGQVDIGNVPPPRVVYSRPVVVRTAPEFADAPPIYLHVRPGHERHWSRHCAEYNACGRRVLFVRDEWYNNEYVPRYRRDHEHDHFDRDHDHSDHDRDHDHGHDHDHDHDRDGRH